ncbi:MAG: hypothetical protein M3522_12750 [Actinomycetota bacterium]|nr:hypothetical protein [Actinomycetota bacterium]
MIDQLASILAAILPQTLAFALTPAVALLQSGDYGFWAPIISALRAVGVALSGIGLMVAILIKGAAGTNGDRHAFAARVAEGVFAGLFVVLLGWFIYDRMLEWTPL